MAGRDANISDDESERERAGNAETEANDPSGRVELADHDGSAGDDGRPIRWVTLATFWQPTPAHIARLKLESEGIDAILADENIVSTDWLVANAVGGIKLQVPAEDLAAARDILETQASPAPLCGETAPVLEYANPIPAQRVAVARFPDSPEAHLAAAKLESEGVPCDVVSRSSRYGMGPESSLIAVAAQDVDRAIGILEQTPARIRLIDDGSDAKPAAPSCPKCQSDRLRRSFPWGVLIIGAGGCAVVALWVGAIAFLALGVLWFTFFLKDRPFHCDSCGHEWRDDDEGAVNESDDVGRRPPDESEQV